MSIQPYFKESYMPTPGDVQKAIAHVSPVRKVFPFKQTLQWFDKRYEWYKEIEDFNSAYTWELVGTPDSGEQLQEANIKAALIHRKMVFKPGEFERIQRSPLTVDERINNMIRDFQKDEERIVFGTQCPDTQVYGISDTTATTGNSVDTSTELNVTSIANAHSTLTAQVQELAGRPSDTIEGISYAYRSKPLMCGLTTDVYNKAASTISSADGKTEVHSVLQYMQKLLEFYGGPGSLVYHAAWLDATVTKSNVNRFTVTANTRESILYPYDINLLHVNTSAVHPWKIDCPEKGKTYGYAYRFVLLVKNPAAVRYGDAPVIA